MAHAASSLLGRRLGAASTTKHWQLAVLMEGRLALCVPARALQHSSAAAAAPFQPLSACRRGELATDGTSPPSVWTVATSAPRQLCSRHRSRTVCLAASGGASGEVGPGAPKGAGKSSSSSPTPGKKHKGGKARPASPTIPPAGSAAVVAGTNGAPASASQPSKAATLVAAAPGSRGAAVVVEEVEEELVDGEELGEEEAGGTTFLACAQDANQGQSLAPFMDAVVKVYCVHTEPNYSLPWQRKRQTTSTSSGFMVMFGGKRRLLTNAHSVDYYTQVKVKRRGDDRKFLARVLSIGVDCDVALLDVEDQAFWEGATPLEFGTLPRLQDAVAVVGYPIGGDTISVTAGVVSRIEVTDYTHGSTDLLAIQIDAAINGGNSGGPVFNARGECCGIAFQALVGSDVENVGYVIPTQVVQHFLTDYERTGAFTGFPALGVRWQRMESDALRRAFGLATNQKGVLVRDVNPTSAAAHVLRPNDVLLSFDGVAISNDGTVPFRTGERIAFSYLISNKYVGDECVLRLLRDGKEQELNVKLSKPAALIPPHLSNRDPSYFIVAGLVFTSVSEPYLQSEYGSDYATDSPVKLLEQLYHGMPQTSDQEVVVLSQVLACDATLGYEDIYNVQVLRFNQTPVNNLRHLAELVSSCTEPYMRWDLEYKEVVVLETSTALAATPDVMRSHSVPFVMSADLRKEGIKWPPQAQPELASA